MKSFHCLRTCSMCDLVAVALCSLYQFVVFKPLSYCFEETIGFHIKASFTRLPLRLIKPVDTHNKRMLTKSYSFPQNFSWIENHKLIWLTFITWWCYFTTWGILEQTWNCSSVSPPNNWFSQCHFQWIKRDEN